MTDVSLEPIGPYSLRTGITIFPSQDQAIDHILIDLVQAIPATFALLTDSSGQVIGFRGERGSMDLVALGSLVASDLAASQAIAGITNEHEDYQLVLRQGQWHNTFLSSAGRHLVLLVQTQAAVPLGWSRLSVMDAARQLADVLNAPPPELDQLDRPAPQIDTNGLTDLFSQALDDLWST